MLEKVGGVMTLLDVYCLYNRARGTDLISPEDIYIACTKFAQLGLRLALKEFESGVKVIESGKLFYLPEF
jgi:ESCRT-II complex subunit VPS36